MFYSVEVAAGAAVGLTDQVNIPVFLLAEEKKEGEEKLEVVGSGFSFGSSPEEEEGVSSEGSSIGVESSSSSSSSDDRKSDAQDEAQSKLKDGAFRSLDSLEESLPIKRGLSNFFTGKSKSFASISECANANDARDLVKPENPFNKRRRILKTSWSRRASCISLIMVEEAGEEEEEEEEERGGGASQLAPLPHNGNNERKMKKAFKSPRSFSLSDLQHS